VIKYFKRVSQILLFSQLHYVKTSVCSHLSNENFDDQHGDYYRTTSGYVSGYININNKNKITAISIFAEMLSVTRQKGPLRVRC